MGLVSQAPSDVLLSIDMPSECDKGLHRLAAALFHGLSILKNLRKLCLSSCSNCVYFEITDWGGLEHLQLLDVARSLYSDEGAS